MVMDRCKNLDEQNILNPDLVGNKLKDSRINILTKLLVISFLSNVRSIKYLTEIFSDWQS